MKVIKVLPYGEGSNSYILTADGKSAAVIDPALPTITDVLQRHNLKCSCALLTHGHFDHVGGAAALKASGARIYCGEREKDFIFSPENLGIFGGVEIPCFEVDETLKDGREIELCGIKFKVLLTAGHTAGSVCYIAEDCIFSGDTLFRGSVGRTDLPSGNFGELVKSVKKLYALAGDYKVYCGHGDDTTLRRERESNAYIRGN